LASIAGKTIGTNNALWIQLISYTAQTGNFDVDVWGVQLESGTVATPFRRNAPSIQAELAACQRYYWRTLLERQDGPLGVGGTGTTTTAEIYISFPVQMRAIPSAVEWSTLQITDMSSYGVNISAITISTLTTERHGCMVFTTASGIPAAFRPAFLRGRTGGNSFLGFSAEL
jgi:hypothetical protein